jgi:PAS domain S-box-containing protein
VAPRVWLEWLDPAPFFKQMVASGGVAIAIIVTRFLPGGDAVLNAWMWSGVAFITAATTFSLIISTRRSRWRLEGIVWSLDFIALFLLQMASGAALSPLIFLPIMLVVPFSSKPGRSNVVYSVVGSFLALVVPVLLTGGSSLELWVGIFATTVSLQVSVVFYEMTDAQRRGIARLAERAAQLEHSERERANAQRTLQGVWEAVTEQIIIATDFSGRIVSWNPGAERMLGLPRDQVEGEREIVEFHLPSEVQGFRSLVESAARGVAQAGEWTYVRGDGSTFPVLLTVTSRFDEDGATTGYLFVAIDMTEARAIDKLKNDFVGLISHELRTPLSSILGYLELMRDDDDVELSETQLQYLSVAERNAHRLLRLVGDLLFTAQVESGTFALEKQPIDLASILADSLETARPAAATAGVQLESRYADGIVVEGDPVRLGQAIDNLISNAVKFTRHGGTVTVSLHELDGQAIVMIEDTGMGIPADELDKLFGRFFRATTATRNAVQGVGLGLTITKAIVTAHHGRIFVESTEGVGTSFSLVLPLARVAVSA